MAPRSTLCGVLARYVKWAMVSEGSTFGWILPSRPRHQLVVWFGGSQTGLPAAVRVAEPSGTETSVNRPSGRLANRIKHDAVLGRCSRQLLDGDIFRRIGRARRCLRTDPRRRWGHHPRMAKPSVSGSLRARETWKRTIFGMTGLRIWFSRKRTNPGAGGLRARALKNQTSGCGNWQPTGPCRNLFGGIGGSANLRAGRSGQGTSNAVFGFIHGCVLGTATIGQNGFGHGSPGIGNIFGPTDS